MGINNGDESNGDEII